MNLLHSADKLRHLLKVGLVANILEAYEFLVYVYLATIMGQLFFAPATELTALLQVWTLFAISYLARPLGSFFWGIVGDRVSRGYSIQAALLTMSIPTALIGLLPTYSQIGFLATAFLLVLRFIQVFSSGGELPVSGCYIYENTQGNQRSLLCSTVVVSSIIGYLFASLIATTLFWSFDQDTIIRSAWRIPYLLSIPITLWVWHLRKGLIQAEDTEDKSLSTEHHQQVASSGKDVPVKWSFSLVKSSLLPMMIIGAFMQVLSYVSFIWLPTYLIHFLKMSPKLAYLYNTMSLIAWGLFALFAGYLSSIWGYKRIIIVHIVATLLLIYPLFQGLQSNSYVVLALVHLALSWLPSGMSGTVIEMLGDRFPSKVRALGMSFGLTLPATIFGGITPLALTWLTDKTDSLLFPAFYVMGFGCLALPVAVYLFLRSRSMDTSASSAT